MNVYILHKGILILLVSLLLSITVRIQSNCLITFSAGSERMCLPVRIHWNHLFPQATSQAQYIVAHSICIYSASSLGIRRNHHEHTVSLHLSNLGKGNKNLWVVAEKEISSLADETFNRNAEELQEVWRWKQFVYQDLRHTHLQLPTVTFLSLLHVAIATFLPTVEHFDLGHVEQTHPDAFFKTGCQVLLAAAAEHRGERIPVSHTNGERGWRWLRLLGKDPLPSYVISANCC